jgi:hypothetical protein
MSPDALIKWEFAQDSDGSFRLVECNLRAAYDREQQRMIVYAGDEVVYMGTRQTLTPDISFFVEIPVYRDDVG